MADLIQLQTEMAPEQVKALAALAWLRDTFQIVDQDTLDKAGELVKAAKGRWKELEEKRTAITKPLNEAKRGVDKLFKPVLDLYAEAEGILKTKIGAYAAQVEIQRAEIMTASALEHAAGGTPTEAIPEPAKTQGVSTRQVWDFRVDDPDLVPRELCSPDPEKIRKAIWYVDTAKRPPQSIPGLSFFLQSHVTVRTGKSE
jgi:hypothetical protein